MKRVKIKLTGIGEVLTKEAEEKLERGVDSAVFEDLTCGDGRTRTDYENLGMKVPEDLIQKEKEFNNGIILEDEDFEDLEYPVRLYEDEIVGYVRPEEVTIIYTKTGLIFSVKETVEEIDELIETK